MLSTCLADRRLHAAATILVLYALCGGPGAGYLVALPLAALAAWPARRTALEQTVNSSNVAGELPAVLATLSAGLDAPQQSLTQVRGILAEAAAQLAGSFTRLNQLIQQQQRDLQGILDEMQGEPSTTTVTVASLAADIASTAELLGNLTQIIVQVSKRGLDIFDRVEDTAARLQEVERLVSDVKGIADQTTLLALNAAIEAARVGEAGRGFEVVATEVRQLAARSKRVSEEISKRTGQACQAVDAALHLTRENAAQDLTSLLSARAHLTELSGCAHELSSTLRQHIATANESASEISAENAVAVRSLQFEDIARQILERSGHDLNDLRDVAHRLADQAPDSHGLAQLATTLLAEKQARAAHKPSQETVSAGDIELF